MRMVDTSMIVGRDTLAFIVKRVSLCVEQFSIPHYKAFKLPRTKFFTLQHESILYPFEWLLNLIIAKNLK